MKKNMLNCSMFHATQKACDAMDGAIDQALIAMTEAEDVFEGTTNPAEAAVSACREARVRLLRALDTILDRERAQAAQLEAFKRNMEAKTR